MERVIVSLSQAPQQKLEEQMRRGKGAPDSDQDVDKSEDERMDPEGIPSVNRVPF